MDLPKTNEEVLMALGDRLKETSVDNFTVKIERKGNLGLPESLTTCDGVELKYIIKPEDWLSSLFGGGQFILVCYHANEPTKPVGRLLLNFKGDPQMNWSALDSPSWSGPKSFTRREAPTGTTFSETELGGDRRPPPWGAGTRLAGGPGASGGGDAAYRLLVDELRSERQRAQDLQTKLFERMATPQRPAIGLAEIAGIVGAITAPVVTLIGTLVETNATSRAEQARLAADAQKERDRLMSEQQKETRELMRTISAPKPIDPALETLIKDQRRLFEKLSEGGGGESDMMAQNMQLMQTMYAFTTKAISNAAEARLGDKGNGNAWLDAFKEMATAIEHIVTARMTVPSGKPGQQRALPSPGQQTSVDQVFQAILSHQDPAQVAARIVEMAKTDDPAFKAEMEQYGMNLDRLATARLGTIQIQGGGLWALQPDNQEYLGELMEEIDKQGVGVFSDAEEKKNPEPPQRVVVETKVSAPTPAAVAPTPAPNPAPPQAAVSQPATPTDPKIVEFKPKPAKRRRVERPAPDA